eukprot:2903199-Rhodomonas_salina.2
MMITCKQTQLEPPRHTLSQTLPGRVGSQARAGGSDTSGGYTRPETSIEKSPLAVHSETAAGNSPSSPRQTRKHSKHNQLRGVWIAASGAGRRLCGMMMASTCAAAAERRGA